MSLQLSEPVLILGGGINGVAVARELALNGVSSCIVEKHDLCYGATSKSSRLIHGGLRYLEHADFGLVRESLHERNQLVKVAPQFVRPLRLAIPVKSRFKGFACAASRFLRLGSWKFLRPVAQRMERDVERGAFVVGTGLTFYDWIAANEQFPKHSIQKVGSDNLPPFDPQTYRWACSYSDGQIVSPERFVLSMLVDTEQLLSKTELPLEVFVHHHIQLEGKVARVVNGRDEVVKEWSPPLIINSTGAWGDDSLNQMGVKSPRLFGGTKGSHFFTRHPGLVNAVGENGVYAEASDGRPVFVLPLGEMVMVGTTDIHFEQSPEKAIASEQEVDYLLELVNDLIPVLKVTKEDVDMHYCGVRPLPYQEKGSTSAISRGHAIKKSLHEGVAVLTLVGGKLTTCRALGEDVVKKVAKILSLPMTQTSQDRPFPGSRKYPTSATEKEKLYSAWSQHYSLDIKSVAQLFSLWGTRLEEVLDQSDLSLGEIAETHLPRGVVRWVIQHEWASTLEDLVERRLMLLYQPDLKKETLVDLAFQLRDAGCLEESEIQTEIEQMVQRLKSMYGKQVA